jgi:hypothetical protein
MIALCAASTDSHPTVTVASITAEMVAIVTMPSALAIGIVEGAVLAPIAVVERAIGAVVIAIITLSIAGRDAPAVMATIGAAAEQGQPASKAVSILMV